MLNIAADHINAVEAKENAERKTEQEHTERVRTIGVLQRTIADAERRKTQPVFANEEVESIFNMLKSSLDRQAENYKQSMWNAVHSARPVQLNLGSPEAAAHFDYENILAKLPELADQVASRDGRGFGIEESKRATVIAEADKAIASAREVLAAMGV